MQSWRMREPVMWALERITGNRKTFGQNLIGGVRRDIGKEMVPELLAMLDTLEQEWKKLIDAVAGDTTLMARLEGVGILPADMARDFCVVGPTVRGSGIPIDSRVDHPYAAYDELVPGVITFTGCDNWSRVMVRLHETLESIRLIREGLINLPDGPILAPVEETLPPGKEGITVVEAPRGEAIHYVVTGNDYRPYRWRVRAPTYQQLQALPSMIRHATVADVPITLGSMDPCFSCTERLEVVDVKTQKVTVYSREEILKISRRKYGKG
jgi:Ni,Fe-hydrogenase III large subunit